MGVFKRGKVYWYHSFFNGEHVQQSTKQNNQNVARQMEAVHRASLAKGEVGIRERKPVPTLTEFIGQRFEPWAKAMFEKSSPKTWKGWYQTQLRALAAHAPLARRKLDEITGQHIADFAASRQAEGLKAASVNSALQVLRRCLRLAVEWGVIPSAPKVKLLRVANRRERVLSSNEEARYLAAAPEPLASIATVLADTGMRPEECFRLRWESVTWGNGRYGTLLVTHGKTAAARRELPVTPRVRVVLESRWNAARNPEDGWVWPATTRSGHVEPSSLRKQHARAFKTLAEEAAKGNGKPVRPFILYSLRHTFLTRLGQSGCDVWTLARIAGHGSIVISSRYVHPSGDAVLDAMSKLSGARPAQGEVRQSSSSRKLLANAVH